MDPELIGNAEQEVEIQARNVSNAHVRNLAKFCEKHDLGTEAGGEDVELINLSGNPRVMQFPNKKLEELTFQYIGKCVENSVALNILERQKQHSGNYIDLDIYQDEKDPIMHKDYYFEICLNTVHALLSIISPTPDGLDGFNMYGFVLRKPQIVYDEGKQKYKDGMHILFPGVMITKPLKKLLLKKMIEQKVIEAATHGKLLDVDVIDMGPASGPALLYGSAKPGKQPYVLDDVFMAETRNDGTIRRSQSYHSQFITEVKPSDWTYEMSVNYQRPGGLVKKMEFAALDSVADELKTMERQRNTIIGNNDELSMLAMCDPEAKIKLELLALLGDHRATEYDNWYKIIIMLAYMGEQYRQAALAFTSKAHSGSQKHGKFADIWDRAITTPVDQRMPYGLAMLKAMAKADNPTEYAKIMNGSLMSELTTMIFENRISKSQHYNTAKVMNRMNGEIFFTDIPRGDFKPVWWMFEVRDVNGGQYEYRPLSDDYMISQYISDKLPLVFTKAQEAIQWRKDNTTDENTVKFYTKKLKTVDDTVSSLYNSGAKMSVMKEATVVYRADGLSSKMDQSTIHTGVINGVLEIENRPILLTGRHSAYVSRNLNARWTGFDPTNEMTIYVWTKFWNMFPNTEKDAFHFILSYISTLFSNKVKSSLIMKVLGNGSNGKSMTAEATGELMGESSFTGYGGKLPSQWLFEKDTNADSATAALCQLINARLTFISETEKSQYVRTSKIKKLTSQEREMYRQLFKQAISAKHKSLFMFMSNFEFLINTTEHGIWRRLMVYIYKIRFCKNADPSKNESEEDPELNRTMISDPEFLSSYMSILAIFHCCNNMAYKGDITDYPCASVDRETLAYRKSQDRMHAFLTAQCVKVSSRTPIEVDLAEVIDAYIEWYAATYKEVKHDRVDVGKMLGTSIIGSNISTRYRNKFLVGHRILAKGCKPGKNERFVVIDDTDETTNPKNQFVDTDTPFQGLMRFWDSYQSLLKKHDTWTDDDERENKKVWVRATKYARANGMTGDINGVFDERKEDIWPTPKTKTRRMERAAELEPLDDVDAEADEGDADEGDDGDDADEGDAQPIADESDEYDDKESSNDEDSD